VTEPSLPDKVVAIDHALERARIAHAFGGAIALGFYAEPRATIDIDVNVFVDVGAHAVVSKALSTLGFDAKIDDVRLQREGHTVVRWGRTPVDLFFAYDPFHNAMEAGVRKVLFGEDFIPILGPEHLVVCKATFDRAKDWIDIDQVLVAVEGFDVGEVRRWLSRITGPDDARYLRFDNLARDRLGR